MIRRQKPIKPLLGQEIEHLGECRMLYELACILVQVGSLLSGSLQLHTFQPHTFLVLVLTNTVALGFSTVTENSYFDFAFLLQLC